MNWLKDGFTISDEKMYLDIHYIHDFLSNKSYWAGNIPFEIVQRSINGSFCFGLYNENKKQIGFARVITDLATFGYLADVFVEESYRGHGLGKWLMEVILSHPNLQGLRGWMLRTRDAHGLYEKFGFVTIQDTKRIMGKFNPNVYAKKEE